LSKERKQILFPPLDTLNIFSFPFPFCTHIPFLRKYFLLCASVPLISPKYVLILIKSMLCVHHYLLFPNLFLPLFYFLCTHTLNISYQLHFQILLLKFQDCRNAIDGNFPNFKSCKDKHTISPLSTCLHQEYMNIFFSCPFMADYSLNFINFPVLITHMRHIQFWPREILIGLEFNDSKGLVQIN